MKKNLQSFQKKKKSKYIHCLIIKVFESSFHLKYSLVTTFLTEVVFISLFSKSANLSLKHPLHVFKKIKVLKIRFLLTTLGSIKKVVRIEYILRI